MQFFYFVTCIPHVHPQAKWFFIIRKFSWRLNFHDVSHYCILLVCVTHPKTLTMAAMWPSVAASWPIDILTLKPTFSGSCQLLHDPTPCLAISELTGGYTSNRVLFKHHCCFIKQWFWYTYLCKAKQLLPSPRPPNEQINYCN